MKTYTQRIVVLLLTLVMLMGGAQFPVAMAADDGAEPPAQSQEEPAQPDGDELEPEVAMNQANVTLVTTENGLKEAIDAAQAGAYIKLNVDVEVDNRDDVSAIKVSENITLDLNGHTISYIPQQGIEDEERDALFTIETGVSLKVISTGGVQGEIVDVNSEHKDGTEDITAVHEHTRSTAFHIEENATLLIQNCRIYNFFDRRQGFIGSPIYNLGMLTIEDSILDNNRSYGERGGAIFNKGTVQISRCTLSENYSPEGGAIYNDEGTVTITDSFLKGNKASVNSGGAIYNNKGKLTITNTVIGDNNAKTTGGGILSVYGDITLNNSIVGTSYEHNIWGNNAMTGGGGIDFEPFTSEEGDPNDPPEPEVGTASLTMQSGSKIFRNGADQGGGILVSGYIDLTLTMDEDCEISGNTAMFGGGIFNAGRIDATGCAVVTLKGNGARINGAGLLNSDDASFTAKKLLVTGNFTAKSDGGGICNMEYASIVVEELEACKNTAQSAKDSEFTSDGGGIFNAEHASIEAGTLNVYGNKADTAGGIYNADFALIKTDELNLYGNLAVKYGGGARNRGEIKIAQTGLIEGNFADTYGGGIANHAPGKLTAQNLFVYGNIAKGNAGGINNQGVLNLTNAKIGGSDGKGNTAGGDGGGLRVQGGELTITTGGKVIIEGNEAGGSGGGVMLYSGALELDGVTVSGNNAKVDGGGIYVYAASKLTIEGCTISGNEAANNGGGLRFQNGADLTIKGSVFSGNTAAKGGGIYAAYLNTSKTYTFENVTFGGATAAEGNRATEDGGGMYIYDTNFMELELTGSTNFRNNVAGEDGGGIYHLKHSDDPKYLATISAESGVVFEGNSASCAYNCTDDAYLATHKQKILTDSFSAGFTNAYNNFDISYVEPPALYSVTFDANGGRVDVKGNPLTKIYMVESGKTLTDGEAATTASRVNHTFDGWYEDNGSFQTKFNPEKPITGNEILYAKWKYDGEITPNSYTVNYHPNGGLGRQFSVQEPVGTAHTVLSIHANGLGYSFSGYAFRGWSTNPSATSPSYFGTGREHIGADMEKAGVIDLYAVWYKIPVPGGPDPEDIPGDEIPLGDLDLDNHYAYIVGYPDGNVRPDNNVTRGEVAMIFMRLLDEESRDELWATTSSFPDVAETAWYNIPISTLYAGNIVKGHPDGTFRPDNYITRAEFAAIAARFAVKGNLDNATGSASFTDISGHWAEKYIVLASALGYVNGYEDGSFQPNSHITRAEVASLLNNVLGRHVRAEKDLVPGFKQWPDNNRDRWYYFIMLEATNSHDYERQEDGKHETWTELLPLPDWTPKNRR